MIEVDVFWSFAIGAFLAAFAGNLLISESSYSRNDYFVYNVLFLSTIFAPSGLYLLWAFPYWETMYVYTTHASLHPALPTIFASTNVLLGVLGFRMAHHYIRAGNSAQAHALWARAYSLMFGILGFGYRRFLYAGNGDDWTANKKFALTAFFDSEVFYTLLAMGVVLLPALFYGPFHWMSHPANANVRNFPLVGHVAGVVGSTTVLGVLGYLLFLFAQSDEKRAHYEDGPFGYWAPAVAFVVAEAIFVLIVAVLHRAATALLPKLRSD